MACATLGPSLVTSWLAIASARLRSIATFQLEGFSIDLGGRLLSKS